MLMMQFRKWCENVFVLYGCLFVFYTNVFKRVSEGERIQLNWYELTCILQYWIEINQYVLNIIIIISISEKQQN